MRHRHGESGEAFRRRKHQHHGVLFPRLAHFLVAQSGPKVDDLLLRDVSRAGRPNLFPLRKVALELFAYKLKAGCNVAVNLGQTVHYPPLHGSTESTTYIWRSNA